MTDVVGEGEERGGPDSSAITVDQLRSSLTYPHHDAMAQELLGALEAAYPRPDLAVHCAKRAGLDMGLVLQDGPIRRVWVSIVDAAAAQGKVGTLVDRVLADPSVSGHHQPIASLLGSSIPPPTMLGSSIPPPTKPARHTNTGHALRGVACGLAVAVCALGALAWWNWPKTKVVGLLAPISLADGAAFASLPSQVQTDATNLTPKSGWLDLIPSTELSPRSSVVLTVEEKPQFSAVVKCRRAARSDPGTEPLVAWVECVRVGRTWTASVSAGEGPVTLYVFVQVEPSAQAMGDAPERAGYEAKLVPSSEGGPP